MYQDFHKDKHYVSSKDIDDKRFIRYFAGVDWGYEHHGSIVVIGEDDKGCFYVLEEHARQHEEIDYWVEQAHKIKSKYGNIQFYCDSARPEHVKRFKREGFKAINANKAVVSGIEEVAKRFKTDKLFIVEDKVEMFKKEIYMYAWNKRTGEPIKLWDDVLDSIRYAIYSDKATVKAKAVNSLY